MSVEKLLLTVPEAAERLSLSRSKVYELMAAGRIDSVSIGRSRRVPLAACEKFVRALEANGDGVVSGYSG